MLLPIIMTAAMYATQCPQGALIVADYTSSIGTMTHIDPGSPSACAVALRCENGTYLVWKGPTHNVHVNDDACIKKMNVTVKPKRN